MVLEFGKRIHQIELRKVAIYISFICGLIFICSSTAFADSNDNALTEQGQLSADPVSVNDIEPFSVQDTDAIIHQVSDKIAYDLNESGLLSDSGTKAQDYAYSIYQYLQLTIHPDLTGIKNVLQNGIYVDTSNIDVKLGNILQVLYGGATSYPSASTSIWYYLNGMYGMLIDGSLPSGGYGVLAQLPLIEQNLHTASGVSVASSAAGINQGVSTLISSSSSQITYLSDLKDLFTAYNNLSYTDVTRYFTFQGISDTIDGTYTTPTSATTMSEMYLKIHVTGNVSTFNGIKLRLPISYPYNTLRVLKMYVLAGTEYIEVPIEYMVNMNTFYILNCPDMFGVADIYFYVEGNPSLQNITYSPASSIALKVELCSDTLSQKEYFSDLAILDINKKLSDLHLLTEELASEDIRNAKKESQPVIDDTLENFTGNGSAAAKVSDTQAMKSVSSSLKSGLDAGGSVSDALSVFDTSSSIWEWFSQSNSDNINNPSLETRNNQLKSGSSDYVPDFYSQNQIDLLELLGGK